MKRHWFCKQKDKYEKNPETLILKCRWKRLQEPNDNSYTLTDHSQTSYEETNGSNINSVNHQTEASITAGCDVLLKEKIEDKHMKVVHFFFGRGRLS